jgi:hypothetical protein
VLVLQARTALWLVRTSSLRPSTAFSSDDLPTFARPERLSGVFFQTRRAPYLSLSPYAC